MVMIMENFGKVGPAVPADPGLTPQEHLSPLWPLAPRNSHHDHGEFSVDVEFSGLYAENSTATENSSPKS